MWPQRFWIGKLEFVLKWIFCSKGWNYVGYCGGREEEEARLSKDDCLPRAPRKWAFAKVIRIGVGEKVTKLCRIGNPTSPWLQLLWVGSWDSSNEMFRSKHMHLYCAGFWGGEPWWFEAAKECSRFRNFGDVVSSGKLTCREKLTFCCFLLIHLFLLELCQSLDLCVSFSNLSVDGVNSFPYHVLNQHIKSFQVIF